MRKSWTACGYIPEDKINDSKEDAIIPYSAADIGTLMEKKIGEDVHTNFEDKGAIGPNPFPPSDDESDD